MPRNVPTNYSEALAKYNTRRNDGRYHKQLGANTRLQEGYNGIVLYLYATPIVTYHPDGSYTLRADGWHSVTTRTTINAAIRPLARIGSNKAGEWVIYTERTHIVQQLHERNCSRCGGKGSGRYGYEYDYSVRPLKRTRVYYPSSYPCYQCNGTGRMTLEHHMSPYFMDGITIYPDGTVSPCVYDSEPVIV